MSNIIIRQPHPLDRSGTKRINRLLEALSPEYFKLDDRSMQDLLVTAHRYAKMLAWYNLDDRPEGDWTCFWETETLTYLAVLSSIDLNQLQKTYDDIDYQLGLLLESHGGGELELEREAYRQLLTTLVDMARGLEDRYRKLQTIQHPLQHFIKGLIGRANDRDLEELESTLELMIGLHKGKDDDLDIATYKPFIREDSPWGLHADLDYGQIMAMVPSEAPRTQLRAIFLRFYQAYVVLKNRAQQEFDAELARMEKTETEEYRAVQPHISLFIAFLRLFRHAQDSLNGLVKRHLDCFYEDMLGLIPAPAEPDSVYLIFELAKNFQPQLVEKGTKLIGGKGKNGPLFYETVEDWVVSQAKLVELKGFYLPGGVYAVGLQDQNTSQFQRNNKTSLGLEHSLPLSNGGVRAFADDINATEQELGFVIASPQLLLQEGKRLFEVTITGPQLGLTADSITLFLSTEEGWTAVEATNGLFSVVDPFVLSESLPANTEAGFTLDFNDADNQIRLRVFLPRDFPPLVSSSAISMTAWPALKLQIKKDTLINIGSNYNSIFPGEVESVSVSVRAEGVSKNLILQTDQGVFDGTQEVLPFGATAPKGARFHVGFAEAFLKRLNAVRLRPNWVEPFASQSQFANHYADYDGINESGATTVEFLKDSVFSNGTVKQLYFTNAHSDQVADTSELIFENLTDTVEVDGQGDGTANFAERAANPNYSFSQYDPSIRRGFMRLTFNGELGHDNYAKILANKTIELSNSNAESTGNIRLNAIETIVSPFNDSEMIEISQIRGLINANPSNGLPNEPYTPAFNAMELDYVSHGQVMHTDLDQFFYLHPFNGHEEAVVFDYDALPASGIRIDATLLKDFYQLQSAEGEVLIDSLKGHLYLGFEGLSGDAGLSIFIQTTPGSEKRASANRPALHWQYLTANNTWELLGSDKIILDSTAGLTKSGIIQLSIPEGLSSEGNTILNSELSWLKVSAVENENSESFIAALPNLEYIKAQVIKAQLIIEEEDYEHLATGQPAGTITKLAISRSAIKKVEQPFSSFGGRFAEQKGMDFYLRISERLRHRDRAVNIWDYEHLLLQQFLEIALVKCISHTYYRGTSSSEHLPGHVVVAVIPDLANRLGVAREQPRFSKGELDEMQAFLLARSTMFLGDKTGGEVPGIVVLNPQYEPIKIDAQVVFNDDVADTAFFKLQLAKDLHQLLSPWLDGSEQPCFGRTIRRSHIKLFIEQLPYINYLDSLTIVKNNTEEEEDKEHIHPSSAHSILYSAGLSVLEGHSVEVVEHQTQNV